MRPTPSPLPINTEKLAYWYFRLNGCLTIENFVVHPDDREGQRTDADILGVRFPHRRELATSLVPMKDDVVFGQQGDKPLLFIAEVKRNKIELNGAWTNPIKQNLHRVLYAIGALPETEVDIVATALYEHNRYENDAYSVRLFAVGDVINERYLRERPNVIQVTWSEILGFVHERFRRHLDIKRNHKQWDRTAHELWHIAENSDKDEFAHIVRARLEDGDGNRLSMAGPLS